MRLTNRDNFQILVFDFLRRDSDVMIAIKCKPMSAWGVWFLGWNWILIRPCTGVYHALSCAKAEVHHAAASSNTYRSW